MVISALSALRGTFDMVEELQSKTQQNEVLQSEQWLKLANSQTKLTGTRPHKTLAGLISPKEVLVMIKHLA